MCKIKIEMILIPDVHGRNFWKDAIPYKEKHPEIPVLFFGDLHDPYGYEGITEDESFKNLSDIFAFCNSYSNVKILTGNHDLSYYDRGECMSWSVYANRFDCANAYAITDLFHANDSVFTMCDCTEINGKKFLFSHAGIHEDWIKVYNIVMGTALSVNDSPSRLCEDINCRFRGEYNENFVKLLRVIGYSRGGRYRKGSMVWADASDFEDQHTDFIQVFGHTQQVCETYDPVTSRTTFDTQGKLDVNESNICIDCHRIFIIDSEGEIKII